MVVVNHDYPQRHALRVLREDGTPIEGARIAIHSANRCYCGLLSDWVTQQNVLFGEKKGCAFILYDEPNTFSVILQTGWAGETYTDENGEWIDDIPLPEAHTWLLSIDERVPGAVQRVLEVTT